MDDQSELTNPMGLDGFEFVEFTSLEPEVLASQFESMGFTAIAKHKSKDVTLYRQGGINFIINAEHNCHAYDFARDHGPSACAMGFRVRDAKAAFERAISLGAESLRPHPILNPSEVEKFAIYGVGRSLIYFVDRYINASIYDYDFNYFPDVDRNPPGVGLNLIDHLTHNVHRGDLDDWSEFYRKIFNFRQIRYFDIKGSQTGLISRAMASPCGKIKIPINESTDDKSQIEEFIQEFNGEGIQHIALTSDDIYASVEALRENNLDFMDVPDTYYEMIAERLPNHGEDLARLHKNFILIDGDTECDPKKILLQIFTNTMLGPVFFEIIQRKGDEGFGEGNFTALFESIERDQIRRGVLKEDDDS